jgi:RNA methyltransferase, TrmH family
MKKITSLNNNLIKRIVSLTTKKGRTEYGLFIAEGERTCSTLIAAGMKPEYIIITEEMITSTKQESSNHPLIVITPALMKKISPASSPSGLMMIFPIPTSENAKLGTGLVLYNLQDPGNVGTLIRSSAAMGIRTVVLIEGADPWSHKVVQASAGTIGLVTIHQMNWDQLLKAKGPNRLCAMVVSGGQPLLEIVKNRSKTLLIIGNEAQGLPKERLTDCDHLITLSMPGKTESLNAAVAGSIGLYLLHTN